MQVVPDRVFESEHPAVLATYVVAVTATTMCAFHPVFAAISLAGALLCALVVCGPERAWATLRWQLPLFVVVVLANPVFSRLGQTLLVQVGPIAIHLESLVFGLCMGMMLVSSLLWLWCATSILTLDRLLALGGGVLPTVGLMVSMTMRLVPQLLRRGGQVRTVRAACSGAPRVGNPVQEGARLSGILLSWSLEDSVERSDAMRARGWAAGRRRSHYLPWRTTAHDVIRLALLLALVALDAFLERVACSQWAFYPTMPHLVPWWGYAPHAVLVLLPTLTALADRMGWERTGRRACQTP